MLTKILKLASSAFLLSLAVSAILAAAGIKLYLKDGSYQLVKAFQVQGNRVRYYSLERDDWEEIPKSLVDFSATRRGEAQEKASQRKILEQAQRIEHQRFDSLPSAGYQIKPGIGLPTAEGVYLFDGSVVWPLVQSTAQVERDKKRLALSLALPGPLLKSRSWVVLEGTKAAVRVAVRRPIFFIEAAGNWGAKAELIPLKVMRHQRLVESIQSGVGIGQPGERRLTIPLIRTRVAPGILKLIPANPLRPGEYAIGELLPRGRLNIDVWDFGINKPSRRLSTGR
jgi:hypothetical protein